MNIKEATRINLKILTEEQLSEIRNINQVINEELGINDESVSLAKKLTSAVCKDTSDTHEYNVKIAGRLWKIIVRLLNIDKNTDIRREERDYLGVTYFDARTIAITAYRIGGKIKPDKFMDVAAHEILHAFNVSSSNRDGYIRSERNKNIYIRAATEAKKGKTDLDRCIGYVIYLSNKFEANAFENGLYSYLMSCDLMTPGDEEKAMAESMIYKRLTILKRAEKLISENPEEVEKIVNNVYGKSLAWIQRLSSASLRNCRRQIGRALVKFRKDYDWTHGGKTLVSI